MEERRQKILQELENKGRVREMCIRDSTEEEYKEAVRRSFEEDHQDEVVIEPYITGQEYACGILAGKALPLVEIIPRDGIFNYENKYQAGGATELCPPVSLDEKTQKKMRRAGEKAFQVLHMDVYGRADFIVDETDGRFYCLEMNGLPGMTPVSYTHLVAVGDHMKAEHFPRQVFLEGVHTGLHRQFPPLCHRAGQKRRSAQSQQH